MENTNITTDFAFIQRAFNELMAICGADIATQAKITTVLMRVHEYLNGRNPYGDQGAKTVDASAKAKSAYQPESD